MGGQEVIQEGDEEADDIGFPGNELEGALSGVKLLIFFFCFFL